MKIQMFILASAIIAASVGCNNSTNNTANDKDTVVVEKNTTNTVKTVEVTPVIQTRFVEQYPEAKNVEWTYYEDAPEYIDWELTGWPTPATRDYTANYTIDNTNYWSWYTPDGDWVATVTTINNADLPASVNQTIQNQFAGYTVTSVDKENDKNRTAYEVEMQNGEDKMKALIDENGNVLKKKGKENGEKVKEKNL